MAINFKKVAQKEVTLSEIMVDRSKLDIDQVSVLYPNGITIDGFDFATVYSEKTKSESTFAVCTFKEDPTKYIMCGAVMTKICTAWCEACPGLTIDQISNELKASGGVRVKFSKTTTKKGNNLTAVEIL